MSDQRPLYAYYFPSWHPDARNDVWHGKGWTEWEVLRSARPRFEGHLQPKRPLWGYEDESLPQAMEKKIDAAVRHGIDGFVFDWYWSCDGPYRQRCLDEGFLGAANNESCRFAIMWANHDLIYVHPASRMHICPVLSDGDLSVEQFLRATDHCIRNYFPRPNYIRNRGKLLFSFFRVDKLVKSFGGLAGAASVLGDFRARVRAAGLGELEINVIGSYIPGYNEGRWAQVNEFLRALSIDSVMSYGWKLPQDEFPATDYRRFRDNTLPLFRPCAENLCVPFHLCAAMGWDVSPRTVPSEMFEQIGYPYTPCVVGNTPEAFEEALRMVRDMAESPWSTGDFVMLNAWNEWTEGSYLEPEADTGFAYLEAVRRTFAP